MAVGAPTPTIDHPVQAEVITGLDAPLRRSVSWSSAVLLAVGAALLITISMGPMAADLGNLQVLVWAGAALIGLVHCFLIGELAIHSPGRAGGTATYAHEALGTRAPWLAALSSWGYWFAWTPGIAVNLILAAQYLRAVVAPDLNTVALGLVIGAVLYVVNALGLRITVQFSVILAALAGIPLLLMLLAPLVKPSLFHGSYVWPFHGPTGQSTGSTAVLAVKWLFVATWSAYGAEIASTIVAEFRDGGRTAVRAMSTAGITCLVAFTAVPWVMTGLVGPDQLANDADTVFLTPAEAVFGRASSDVVGLMLAGALILGAQAFIVASSRTVYQMSRDGYLPRTFSRVNRFGVPITSMICDAAVIALLVGLFGTDVIDVVASANVGYLVVFVLLPLSFVVLRRQRIRRGEILLLPRPWTAVGVALVIFNLALLIVGAALWGAKVALTGAIVMAAIFPLMWARRWSDRRRYAAVSRPADEPARQATAHLP